jgi:hypothetical protein
MSEAWHLQDDLVPLTGEAAVQVIREWLERGELTCWLDTVELGVALTVVEHVVDHGVSPAGVAWQIDR